MDSQSDSLNKQVPHSGLSSIDDIASCPGSRNDMSRCSSSSRSSKSRSTLILAKLREQQLSKRLDMERELKLQEARDKIQRAELMLALSENKGSRNRRKLHGTQKTSSSCSTEEKIAPNIVTKMTETVDDHAIPMPKGFPTALLTNDVGLDEMFDDAKIEVRLEPNECTVNHISVDLIDNCGIALSCDSSSQRLLKVPVRSLKLEAYTFTPKSCKFIHGFKPIVNYMDHSSKRKYTVSNVYRRRELFDARWRYAEHPTLDFWRRWTRDYMPRWIVSREQLIPGLHFAVRDLVSLVPKMTLKRHGQWPGRPPGVLL